MQLHRPVEEDYSSTDDEWAPKFKNDESDSRQDPRSSAEEEVRDTSDGFLKFEDHRNLDVFNHTDMGPQLEDLGQVKGQDKALDDLKKLPVEAEKRVHVVRAESAGFQAGNYARIFIDDE